MTGYWLCVYENINNIETLKEYAVKAKPTIEDIYNKFLITSEQRRKNEGIDEKKKIVLDVQDYHM